MHLPQITLLQQPNRLSSVVGGCFSVLVDMCAASCFEGKSLKMVAHVQHDSRDDDMVASRGEEKGRGGWGGWFGFSGRLLIYCIYCLSTGTRKDEFV